MIRKNHSTVHVQTCSFSINKYTFRDTPITTSQSSALYMLVYFRKFFPSVLLIRQHERTRSAGIVVNRLHRSDAINYAIRYDTIRFDTIRCQRSLPRTPSLDIPSKQNWVIDVSTFSNTFENALALEQRSLTLGYTHDDVNTCSDAGGPALSHMHTHLYAYYHISLYWLRTYVRPSLMHAYRTR